MKKTLIISLAILATLTGTVVYGEGQSTIGQIQPWKILSGVLQPANNTHGLKVPSLASSGDCVTTDATGLFSTGDCGSTSTGNVATSSAETATYLPFWTSTNGTPATLSGGSSSLTWDGTKLYANQASTTLSTNTDTLWVNRICYSDGQCISSPATNSTQITFYKYNASMADIAGYESLYSYPPTGTETDESCTAKSGVAGGYCLIDAYVSTSTDRTLTGFPAGTWQFDGWNYVNSATGVSNVVANVYKRTSTGTETLLFQATSTEINNLTLAPYAVNSVQSAFSFNANGTDRLVIKYYGWTDSGVNKIIHTIYGSSAHYGSIHTPATVANLGYASLFANQTFTGANTFSGATTTFNNAIKFSTYGATGVMNIYADEDTNSGIHFDGPDIISLHTGGDDRLLINAAGNTLFNGGNVGIATTSPYAKLSIAGNIVAHAINGSYFTATSTATSTFPRLSSTLGDFTGLCIGGDCKTAWPTVTDAATSTLLSDNNTWSGINIFSNADSTFAGTAAKATALATARNINGVAFDGTAAITITAASSTLLANNNTWSGANVFSGSLTGTLTGNADTATALATARAINGVNFDGTAPITITAASSTLLANNNTFSGSNTFSSAITGSVTGNAGTATALATARAINGVNFDGTAPITITAASSTALANNNTWSGINIFSDANSTFAGTAAKATVLATARNINGVAFDGSAAITVTAASSTLLANNNTWSGLNIFGNSTTTKATATSLWFTTLFSSLSTALMSIASDVVTLLGTWDFGGATAVEIPNGTGNTFNAIGQIGFDTTDNQLLIATSTDNYPAVLPTRIKLFAGGLASTSPDFVSGGIIPTSQQIDGFIVDSISCQVDGGTSVVINLSNAAGTTDSTTVTCDTDGQTESNTANKVYAAGSFNRVELGTVTGAVDYLTYSVWGYITRE